MSSSQSAAMQGGHCTSFCMADIVALCVLFGAAAGFLAVFAFEADVFGVAVFAAIFWFVLAFMAVFAMVD